MRKAAWIRPTAISYCEGSSNFYQVDASIQDRKCSSLMPDGPLALFCNKWQTDLATSSGTKLSTGKGSSATMMLHPWGGAFWCSTIISSVIREIVTHDGGGGAHFEIVLPPSQMDLGLFYEGGV